MILVTAFVLFVVKNPDSESFTLMNSFALVTVIIIQRDFGIEKNRVSTRCSINRFCNEQKLKILVCNLTVHRILYWTICMTAIVLYGMYGACLTSEMTAIAPSAQIRVGYQS